MNNEHPLRLLGKRRAPAGLALFSLCSREARVTEFSNEEVELCGLQAAYGLTVLVSSSLLHLTPRVSF
ncbi:hypothetical protein Y1Q_0016465 [Alligator mississippiensis]|uniref:Uncharacterized protein n=1 Tax=Alligator mississippiensis TaxID=8496 RepID=A0A151N2R1_ALLMI|nr:hypothetical protein Y1Q_0016465 [Alligator mississippiensis]